MELERIAAVAVLSESMAFAVRSCFGLQLELELDRTVAAVALLAKLVLAMAFQLDRTIELAEPELALAPELTSSHRLVRTTRLLSSPTSSCRCLVSISCPVHSFAQTLAHRNRSGYTWSGISAESSC